MELNLLYNARLPDPQESRPTHSIPHIHQRSERPRRRVVPRCCPGRSLGPQHLIPGQPALFLLRPDLLFSVHALWLIVLANSESQHLVLGLIRSVVVVCQNFLVVGTSVWDHSLQFY